MKKLWLVVAPTVLVLAGTLLFPSTGMVASRPTLTAYTVHSPDTRVGPGQAIGEIHVRCASGYVATGFGVLNGALDLVYATPTTNGRGYDFAFGNSSSDTTFTGIGEVRCVKGTRLNVVARISAAEKARAVRDARVAMRE